MVTEDMLKPNINYWLHCSTKEICDPLLVWKMN